jgi:molybdopterin synthase sulfur carrier subunit
MQVHLFATLRQVAGQKTVELALPEAAPVQAMLDTLLACYPALRPHLCDHRGALYPHVHLFVNGRDARYLAQGLDTPLQAADVISLFPAVGGG